MLREAAFWAALAFAASRRLFEERVGIGAPDPLNNSSVKELAGLPN